MPAPHRPNTVAAAAARRRIGDDKAATRLRDHGWLVIPPDGETDTPTPMRREDERSLWLHHAFAAKLIADPEEVIARVRRRLDNLRALHHGQITRYFDSWQRAVDAGPHVLLAVMTANTELGQTMRAASPFSGAGLLTEAERTQLRETFKAWWRTAQNRVAA